MRWALVDFWGRCACHAKDKLPPTDNVFDRVPLEARADFGRALAAVIRDGGRQTFSYVIDSQTESIDIEPLQLRNLEGPLALIAWRDSEPIDASGDQIRRLARRNDAILRSAMDGFFVVDNQYRFLEANEAFCRMLGYKVEELLAMRITDLEVPIEQGQPGYQTNTGLHHFAGAHRHKLGHIVYLELSINVLSDEGRKILVGFARDVTERLRAEEEVARLTRQQRLILDAVDEGIVGLDKDGRITFVNPATARLLGGPPGRMIGRTTQELFCNTAKGGDCELNGCAVCHVLDGSQRTVSAEGEFARLSGERFPVEYTASAIYEGATLVGAVLVFKDMSQKRKAEEERRLFEQQLQQSQRLESLGLLAGGIAHDLNNMLVGILGNASLSLSQLDDRSGTRDRLTRIVSVCERASRVIRQILAYSGQVSCEVAPVDLNEFLEGVVEFARIGVTRAVTLETRFEPASLIANIDAGQMHQVVTNLVVNAFEAIGERPGRISISTRRVTHSQHELRRLYPGQELVGDAWAAISVEDDGCGMSAETLEHIFEPFFSRKGAGRGLGLSAMHGIVRTHQGGVRVESELGKGTRFTVLLPLSPATQPSASQPQRAVPIDAGRTVLVIDDEDDVRDVVEAMLQSEGLNTISASGGREGVELFSRHSRTIDAVLLDMTMPGMSGGEVYREIHAIRPDAPIVVSSGYSEESIPARLGTSGTVPFLPKPFTKHALLEKISAVLSERARATALR